MKLKFGIKEVVAIGIGTALFVALTQIQIPTPIPNTYLQPRMAVMAFLAAVFGPLVGGIVGLLGQVMRSFTAASGGAGYSRTAWWVLSSAFLPQSMRSEKADSEPRKSLCSSM